MTKVGLKIESGTYEKLKWLKTRFDFAYEYSLSWDEFFQAIVKDGILILAQDLMNSRNGNLKVEEILNLLTGNNEELRNDLKHHLAGGTVLSGKRPNKEG
ncbi:MAG: hypothetical protein M1375_04205 [Candidatus Thermoplasmatota archaeon]|jgi:hypothetical protein|nr:hypothetical protein [Candidatus Thermoplasmatota archaeon]MCL5791158.1 hypothetical protein [Candidatus Thermoplasmatota archaeon]